MRVPLLGQDSALPGIVCIPDTTENVACSAIGNSSLAIPLASEVLVGRGVTAKGTPMRSTTDATTALPPRATLSGNVVLCTGNRACTKNGNPFAFPVATPNDSKPAVNASYTADPYGFPTEIVSPPAALAGTTNFSIPIYSTKSTFSANATYLDVYTPNQNRWLFTRPGSTWQIFEILDLGTQHCAGSGPWTFSKTTQSGVTKAFICMLGNGDDPVIHWMQTNDDCFYYMPDTRIIRYCISTNTNTLIHDFAASVPGCAATVVYTRSYNNWSKDDDHVGLFASNSSGAVCGLIAYEVHSDTVTGFASVGNSNSNTYTYNFPVGVSAGSHRIMLDTAPDGLHLMVIPFVCTAGNNCPYRQIGGTFTEITGFETVDMALNHVNTFDGRPSVTECTQPGGVHWDTAIDAQGNSVLVTQCQPANYNGLDSIRFSDGYRITYHVQPGIGNQNHISGSGSFNKNGYVLVSVFSPNPGLNPDQNGAGDAYLVYLGPETSPGSHMGTIKDYMMFKHHSARNGNYWAEAHCTSDYNLIWIHCGTNWAGTAGSNGFDAIVSYLMQVPW